MNRNHDPAKAAQVHVLEPIEFDLGDAQSQTQKFGQTAAPVTVLPAVEFDLEMAPLVPTLQLTLYLQPDADPAGLTLDVLRFFQAISRCERELGGTGLSWDETRSRSAPGMVQLAVTPNEQAGARERLTRLAGVVQAAQDSPATNSLLRDGNRFITKWEVLVLAA